MSAPPKTSPLVIERILWAGLFFSTLLYVGVLLAAAHPTSPTVPQIFPLALGCVGAVLAVVSFVLPAKVLGAALERNPPAIIEELDPSAPEPLFRENRAMRRVYADPEATRALAHRLAFTPFIVSLAISESIGIFGLVLGMLGFPPAVLAPFFVACWLLLGARFPTEARSAGPLERRYGIKLPRP